MDDLDKKYREHLVLADQKTQEDFDKTVIALSGGALAISVSFLDHLVDLKNAVSLGSLLAAWLLWVLSLTAVLSSFFFSQLALRRAIAQVDRGTIHDTPPGGVFNRITKVCNGLGALAFLVGLFLIADFVSHNIGGCR